MSCSLAKQVQLGLLRYCQETTACKNDAYFLAKQLDVQETTLHLPVSVPCSPSFPRSCRLYYDEVIAP